MGFFWGVWGVYEEHFRGRLHVGLYLQSGDGSDFQVKWFNCSYDL